MRANVERIRADKKKKAAVLAELRATYPAYSDEELRILIELVPSAKVRRHGAILQRALVVTLVLLALLKIGAGLLVFTQNTVVGGVLLGSVGIIVWLIFQVVHYHHQAYVLCAGLSIIGVLRSLQSMGEPGGASALGVGLDVVFAAFVISLALACRAKLFPNLTWQGKLR